MKDAASSPHSPSNPFAMTSERSPSSPAHISSNQRFAAALKKNLLESHRACRAIQVECRYLVKDLEVELKQEIVDLIQEFDSKLKLAVSMKSSKNDHFSSSSSSPGSPKHTASKRSVDEHTEDTKQLIAMFDGHVNALREDMKSDIKVIERKFDSAMRSQQEHLRQTRAMVETMESSLSNQIESIVEDTQNAFVSAFNKYTSLENAVAALTSKQNQMEAKVDSLSNVEPKVNSKEHTYDISKKTKQSEIVDDHPETKKKKKKKKKKNEEEANQNHDTRNDGEPSEYAPSEVPSEAPSDSGSLASLESLSSKGTKVKGRRYKSRVLGSDVKIPGGSVGQYVLTSVKPYAKQPALVEASDTEVVTTYRMMVNQVQSCAIAMTYCGIKPKNCVVVALPSTSHIPIVFLATSLIGATCVPVSPNLKAADLKRISADVGGAVALFATSEFVDSSPDLLGGSKEGGFQIIVRVPTEEDEAEEGKDTFSGSSGNKPKKGELLQYSYDELLALGRAKKKVVPPPSKLKGSKSIALFGHTCRTHAQQDRLVGLSHTAVMSTIVALSGKPNEEESKTMSGEFQSDDVIAVGLPFWDVRALCGVVLPAIAAGACLVCPGPELTNADPSTMLMMMTNHASGDDGNPRINKMWVGRRTLRYIARNHGENSSAPLTKMFPDICGLYTPEAEASVILKACTRALGSKKSTKSMNSNVCAAGGLIELGGRVVSCLHNDLTELKNTTRMLPLMPGVECKVLNPATGKMCAPGKRGIVLLKGPAMLAGKDYCNPDRSDRYVLV